jgi:hypothetical protein
MDQPDGATIKAVYPRTVLGSKLRTAGAPGAAGVVTGGAGVTAGGPGGAAGTGGTEVCCGRLVRAGGGGAGRAVRLKRGVGCGEGE